MRIFRNFAAAKALMGEQELGALVAGGQKSLLHRDDTGGILKFDSSRPNYVPFFYQAQAETAGNHVGLTPGTFCLLGSADAATYGDRVIPASFFSYEQAAAAFEIETVMEYHLASGVTMTFKVCLCDEGYNELAILYEREFQLEDDLGVLSLKPVINYSGYGYGGPVEGQAVWNSPSDRDMQFINATEPGDNVAILFYAAWDVAENTSSVTLYNSRAAYMRPVVSLSEIPE